MISDRSALTETNAPVSIIVVVVVVVVVGVRRRCLVVFLQRSNEELELGVVELLGILVEVVAS